MIKNITLNTGEGGTEALTGALLFGGVGAIVGLGIKKVVLQLRIEYQNSETPFLYLYINQFPTKASGPSFQFYAKAADRVLYDLKPYIDEDNDPLTQKKTEKLSFLSELKILAELYEKGLLSEEEWIKAKKKLLE